MRDISVAPLDSSDHTQILRMMDDENGVTNRKPHRKTVRKSTKDDKRLLLVKDNISDIASSPPPVWLQVLYVSLGDFYIRCID